MNTTAEQMAIAVLKGDLVAARVLADSLLEDCRGADAALPKVTKVTCDWSRLRVVVYVKDEVARNPDGYEFDRRATEEAIFGWLRGRRPESAEVLVLAMIDRLELYELPAGSADPADAPAPDVVVSDEPSLTGMAYLDEVP